MSAYLPRYYDVVSRFFDVYMRVGSFGAIPGLYRSAVDALELRPGDAVLDLCCGNGSLFPYLQQRVGPDGHIVGVDFSARMIDRADQRARRAGWRNVELIHADVCRYDPKQPMDAVVFCLCLSCIPGWPELLQRAAEFLRPERNLVVVDALCARGRWYHPASNLYTRLKGAVIRSDCDADMPGVAREVLDRTEVRLLHGGLYTLIRGRRPSAPVTAAARRGT